MAEGKKRPSIDWEGVEREYRAGIRSLKDIGSQFGVSDAGILKRVKKEGWSRDLGARIKAKAEALVSAREVSEQVSEQAKIAERQIVEVNAAMLADRLLSQREDIRRCRATVNRLWSLVDVELDHPDDLKQLGAILAAPDDLGNDKLNDMYFAAISLPQQVKNVKLLCDAIKTLIELERKVLRLDTMPDQDPEEESRNAIANASRAAAAGIDEAMRALAATVAERRAKKNQ